MHLYEKINSRIQLSSYIGMAQDAEKVLLKCQYIRKQLDSVNTGGLSMNKKLKKILLTATIVSSAFTTTSPILAKEMDLQPSIKRDVSVKGVKSLTDEKIAELQSISEIVQASVEQQKEETRKKDLERKEKEAKEAHEKALIDSAVEVPLCISGSTVKSYMDGAKVTNVATAQYQLLQTMHINEKGNYETDDGYIGVALGSYYGPIGAKYIVTLSTGKTLKVIKADAKADQDVYDGCYHKEDSSMMELIIDTKTAGDYYGVVNGYVSAGNFDNQDEYHGAIVSMKRVADE